MQSRYSFSITRPVILGLSLCTLGLLSVLPVRAQIIIQDLGTLGGNFAEVQGQPLNDAGQVVGDSTDGGGNDLPFFWNSGVMSALGLPINYTGGAAFSINASGQVAGNSIDGSSFSHALLWSGSAITDLLPLAGMTDAAAYSLNNNGQVVGISLDSSGYSHATLWAGGNPTEAVALGELAGDASSVAQGINDGGLVVGYSGFGDGSHAILWQNGMLIPLDDLGLGSVANAINANGEIVGRANTSADSTDAATWDAGTQQLTQLNGIDGANYSEALGLNAEGDVVGYSGADFNDLRATLWSNGNVLDLQSLVDPGSGWQLIEAYGINNQDQIVGIGNYNGDYHAFLITVPEPGPWALLTGLGILPLALRRRLKVRRQ